VAVAITQHGTVARIVSQKDAQGFQFFVRACPTSLRKTVPDFGDSSDKEFVFVHQGAQTIAINPSQFINVRGNIAASGSLRFAVILVAADLDTLVGNLFVVQIGAELGDSIRLRIDYNTGQHMPESRVRGDAILILPILSPRPETAE
jgi:hypothetical protein